jgi:hypothetical protein
MQSTFPKSVRRVVLVQRPAVEGNPSTTVVIHQGRRGRKRQSPLIRPLEKLAHRMLEAQVVASQSLLNRHEGSNQRKKNGWLRDLPSNARRAQKRYFKVLTRD